MSNKKKNAASRFFLRISVALGRLSPMRYRRWRDKAIAFDWYAGMGAESLALIYGVSVYTIKRAVKKWDGTLKVTSSEEDTRQLPLPSLDQPFPLSPGTEGTYSQGAVPSPGSSISR